MSVIIPENYKFGLLALANMTLDEKVPESVELEPNLFALRKWPFPIQDHWTRWVGSLFVERLEGSNLFLVSRTLSSSPGVLDGENKRLSQEAYYIYIALLLVSAFSCGSKPIKLSGANDDGEVRVRQVVEVDKPRRVSGASFQDARIGLSELEQAATLSRAIAQIYSMSSFNRLKRIMRAFVVGITESYADLRLHQFVRCIEGFILPKTGETKRQMKSRTELFIGPGHHDLIEEIYNVRSNVEHLHDPLDASSGSSKRRKVINLLRSSYVVEGIARFMINNFLKTPPLWEHFVTDDALSKFWAGGSTRTWPAQFDVNSYLQGFSEEYIRDELFE